MKRSIKSIVSKVGQADDGKLAGGFGMIKGGTSLPDVPAYNDGCTNTGTCDGTNVNGCTNSGNCSWGTNKNGSCTNSRDCFF